ncbi:MAG TPA: hypothetical protein VHL31_19000 [Geminicoccus sp.]|uniref:hypothetical protein n=1 Tax=Geminicoccus sp. TaxID=2024832 RepID=UPI002E357361|nr:hypothetical protein [Geminicoccus sp.]HEX2528376.1 hypothetical protein [Geminicoccus sp.]
MYSILLWYNWPYVVSDIAPYGDVAADMLLIERAQHDWLLTGHYSRFGFNHPGPFFLYLRHLADVLFGHVLPSPYSAQLLGIIAADALFTGLAAVAVAALAGPDWRASAVAATTPAFVLLIQDNGVGVLAHPWMPYELVAPFLAFVLLLAATAQGRLWMLPAAAFCGGALVHGYVPLLPFVGLPFVLVLAYLFRRARSAPDPAGLPARPLVLSGVIIALFVAPLILDMVIHPPGNLARILMAAGTITPSKGASLGDVAAFVAQFWWPVSFIHSVVPVLWIPAAVGVALAWWDHEARQAVAHVAAIAALMTLLLAFYAWRAPGPLVPFIAQFYLGVPLAVVAVTAAAGLKVAVQWAPRPVGLVVAALAVLLVSMGAFTSPGQHIAGIRVLSSGTLAHLGDSAHEGVRINFDTHDHWPMVAGLLLDLGHLGVPACVKAPHLAVLFTPERICTPSASGRNYEMIASSACGETCFARSDELGVGLSLPAKVPPYPLGRLLGFTSEDNSGRPYLTDGWSIAEGGGTFSDMAEAELVLPVEPIADSDLQLRVKAWGFIHDEQPRQEVEVIANGQPVATWAFTMSDRLGERMATIPLDVARLQQPLSIVLRIPGAASPMELDMSLDARQLGIGLQWLRLDPVSSKAAAPN